MPRVGRHPLKTKDFVDNQATHQKITMTTIVYIPMLSGYWRESFDVLKLFFESLFQSTCLPFDLMVFDNGSCADVQNFLINLKQTGKIQYLTLCQYNLRKLGALNYLLASAPGEFIAYADSDVYFLPGWLDESLKVLSTFPEAGKVTAMPVVMDNSSPTYGKIFDAINALAKKDPSISLKTGILVPDIYINAHRLSLGETSEEYSYRIKNRSDVLLKRGNCEALSSGADFQFTIKKEAIQAIMPLEVEKPEEFGDSIYSPILEIRLDSKGFWQLSTPGYYIHHMGNHVPDLSRELPWLNLELKQGIQKRPESRDKNVNWVKKFFNRILKAGLIRKLLRKIHLLSYRLLYE